MRLKNIKDPDIKMILGMPCKFVDYIVEYESEQTVKSFQRRAKKYNVNISTKSYADVSEFPAKETCSGTVENCIKFLLPDIEADNGYSAGYSLFIDVTPTPTFVNAFRKFVKWISASKWFEEFGEGVKHGKMKNLLNAE